MRKEVAQRWQAHRLEGKVKNIGTKKIKKAKRV